MIASLKTRLKQSRLFAFNLIQRDAWIKRQADALPANARVLDVGAGSCPYRAYYAHCDYRTQDFQKLTDDQLRHGGYGQIDYVCDAAAIPVPDASFDAISCTEVLEHVPDPIRVVREFGRILAPGGKLILTAPLGSGIHQEPYHFYGGFTPYWYQRFLSEAGFVNIRAEPNEGFFSFFSQESLRFLLLASPSRVGIASPRKILWAFAWVLLLPVLGLLIPLSARFLDSFDPERRFTVGYHVLAERAPA